MKTKNLFVRIPEEQMAMLNLLSKSSWKSKASLVREALQLLFKTPGGQA